MKRSKPYTGLQCTQCHRFFHEEARLGTCPKCHGLLDTVLDETVLSHYSKRKLGNDARSMWKFHMFLPARAGTIPVTAGEGDTPLRPVKSFPHLRNIWLKDETRNPTGTFKDRGASLAVTCLSQLGVRRVVLSSEGNAGCSFALYSQMAGINCHVYLPNDANNAKVELSKKLGVQVTKVEGTISDAGRHAANAAEETGAYNASTFVTPFRHDGKGTMALEICQQQGWESPDYIVYPVGGGVGLVGIWKMFKILHRLGWIRRRPRIIAVQPTGCAPVVDAYNKGRMEVPEWKSPKTIAKGLEIPKPLAGAWILKSLRESRGLALKVSDVEIHRAMLNVAKRDGLLVEPSSAAAFAAIPKLHETGTVDRKDSVVVIATGSGLKTLEQF
ncbi:MAG TPA: threonine synthase [Candidatus Limnocylindrales bacterium]|nr:threonine synthase [Candidatus Limnocylindrales bacterium]